MHVRIAMIAEGKIIFRIEQGDSSNEYLNT